MEIAVRREAREVRKRIENCVLVGVRLEGEPTVFSCNF